MHKIMVVDDEVVISAQLERRLSLMGYDVVGKTTSGERSIDMAQRLHPDLILMDIVMPGKLDGIDAAGRIREEMDIPIIFVTAYADDQYLARAKTVRPYGYIVKPFHEKEVRAAIELAIYQKEVERILSRKMNHLHTVVDMFNDAVVCLDRDGNIAVWNRRAQELSGYSSPEVVGKNFSHFIAGEGKDRLLESVFPCAVEPRPESDPVRFPECRVVRKGGGEYTVDLVFFSHRAGEHPFVVCVICEPGAQPAPGMVSESGEAFVSVCSYCSRMRDENGEWRSMPEYFSERWGIRLSHGICPSCLSTYYPDVPLG